MCIFEPFYFGTGTNFPTLRTVDQAFSSLLGTVISFKKLNFQEKTRKQNMRLTLRLRVNCLIYSPFDSTDTTLVPLLQLLLLLLLVTSITSNSYFYSYFYSSYY